MRASAVLFAFAASSIPVLAHADVLRLSDGRKLVGEVSRKGADTLQVVTLDGTVTVRRAEIVSHTAARELRAELRDLAADDAEADSERLQSLARFAAQRGLFLEAFDLLDRALRAAAENDSPSRIDSDLLDLPVGDDHRATPLTPSGLANLLSCAATSPSPARASIAGNRLATKLTAHRGNVPAPLIAALTAGLEDADPRLRVAALRAIATARPRELAARVGDRLVSDRDAAVRAAALEAARAYSPDQHILVRVLQRLDGTAAARDAAIDTLDALGDPHAVGALIRTLAGDGSGFRGFTASMSATRQVAYVSDFDVEVANNATIADPVVSVAQEGASLDVTVYGTSERGIGRDQRERIGRLLDRLTGQGFGTDAAAWKRWLADRR